MVHTAEISYSGGYVVFATFPTRSKQILKTKRNASVDTYSALFAGKTGKIVIKYAASKKITLSRIKSSASNFLSNLELKLWSPRAAGIGLNRSA